MHSEVQHVLGTQNLAFTLSTLRTALRMLLGRITSLAPSWMGNVGVILHRTSTGQHGLGSPPKRQSNPKLAEIAMKGAGCPSTENRRCIR